MNGSIVIHFNNAQVNDVDNAEAELAEWVSEALSGTLDIFDINVELEEDVE